MLVAPPANRCPAHQAEYDRQRGTTAQRGYGHQWQQYAKQAIAQHLKVHGPVCPGWDTPPHSSDDLVCDHDVGPMCRACNSRKAAIADKRRARQARGRGRDGQPD